MILCQIDIKLLRREHGHLKGILIFVMSFLTWHFTDTAVFLMLFMPLKWNSFFLELEPKVFCYTFLLTVFKEIVSTGCLQ